MSFLLNSLRHDVQWRSVVSNNEPFMTHLLHTAFTQQCWHTVAQHSPDFRFSIFLFLLASVCCDAPAVTDELWPLFVTIHNTVCKHQHCSHLLAITTGVHVEEWRNLTPGWSPYWKGWEGEVKVCSTICWPTSFTRCLFSGFYFQSSAAGSRAFFFYLARRLCVHTALHKRAQNRRNRSVVAQCDAIYCWSCAAFTDLWNSAETKAQWWIELKSICIWSEGFCLHCIHYLTFTLFDIFCSCTWDVCRFIYFIVCWINSSLLCTEFDRFILC